MLSAFVLVLLGGVFAFATEEGEPSQFVVEVVMLGLMVGTVAAALLSLAYVSHVDGWSREVLLHAATLKLDVRSLLPIDYDLSLPELMLPFYPSIRKHSGTSSGK